MFCISHSLTSGQAYELALNESTVTLGIIVRRWEVSIPSGSSGTFSVTRGGTHSGATFVAFAANPESGGNNVQPPVANSVSVSGGQQVLGYDLDDGLTPIISPVGWNFPSGGAISYVLGTGGYINIYGDLYA